MGSIAWTIAGFDPSSGAGVTADLMTFASHGLFGCSAITAMTVQTTVGVFACESAQTGVLEATLARLDEDLPAVGIKIGMLATPQIASVVAEFLARKRAAGGPWPTVVLDPVLRASSGLDLYRNEGLPVLQQCLLPCVDWVTPNWGELSVLSEMEVKDRDGAERAAGRLRARYPRLTVVVTGGDLETPADLVVGPGTDAVWVSGEHVATTSTHGTGCAFSSALLSRLVAGAGPLDAVRLAKAFVEDALRQAPGLGHGRGPMELLWPLRGRAAR